MIRVIIVDDHPATAEGLATLLSREPDIEVIGTAPDVALGRSLIASERPDVAICDVELAGGNRGFDLLEDTRDARAAPTAILFLSCYGYPAFYALAWEGGAAGYLLKTEPIDEIVRAVRRAAVGGRTFEVTTSTDAGGSHRRPSRREIELLALLGAGRSNDEIARELKITVRTVESHLRRMFGRYGVFTRTELAMTAVREGWIPLHPPISRQQ